jgi:hypothetical protein
LLGARIDVRRRNGRARNDGARGSVTRPEISADTCANTDDAAEKNNSSGLLLTSVKQNSVAYTCWDTIRQMSDPREHPPYIIAHSEHGDPDCCGVLFAVGREGCLVSFECNQCGAVVRTVPVFGIAAAVEEMRADRANVWRARVLTAANRTNS